MQKVGNLSQILQLVGINVQMPGSEGGGSRPWSAAGITRACVFILVVYPSSAAGIYTRVLVYAFDMLACSGLG